MKNWFMKIWRLPDDFQMILRISYLRNCKEQKNAYQQTEYLPASDKLGDFLAFNFWTHMLT